MRPRDLRGHVTLNQRESELTGFSRGLVTKQAANVEVQHPNALQEKFRWCTVTPTFREIKPFYEHIEGLSR